MRQTAKLLLMLVLFAGSVHATEDTGDDTGTVLSPKEIVGCSLVLGQVVNAALAQQKCYVYSSAGFVPGTNAKCLTNAQSVTARAFNKAKKLCPQITETDFAKSAEEVRFHTSQSTVVFANANKLRFVAKFVEPASVLAGKKMRLAVISLAAALRQWGRGKIELNEDTVAEIVSHHLDKLLVQLTNEMKGNPSKATEDEITKATRDFLYRIQVALARLINSAQLPGVGYEPTPPD